MENKQADSEILKQEVETIQNARNTDTNDFYLVVGIKQELDNEKSEEITVNEGVTVKTRHVDNFNDTMTGPIKVENPDHCGEDVWRQIKDETCASTWSYFTDSHADSEIMDSSHSDLHLQHVGHDIVSEKLPNNIRNIVKTTGNVREGLKRLIVKQIKKNTGDVVDDLAGLPEHIQIEKKGDEIVSFEIIQAHKDNVIMKTENGTGDLSMTSREQRLNKSVKVRECQEILEDNTTNITHNDNSMSFDNQDSINLSENVFCVSRKDIKYNVSSVSSDTIYGCDVCSEVFITCDSLSDHKRKHKVEKPYKCDVCGKEFAQPKYLYEHTKIHREEKPHKCDVCGKGFIRSDTLNVHKRIHTGEKPYKCNVCSRGFTHISSLNNHTKLHTGEKPYKCDICGRGFTQKGNLNMHTKLHTGEKPYKCDVCGKGFTQTYVFNAHKIIHTGQKPYTCNICGKGYNQSGSLGAHIKKHTGQKRFKCNV